MSDLLDIARARVAAGLSVIPIEPFGKLPSHRLLEPGQHITYAANDERAAWRA